MGEVADVSDLAFTHSQQLQEVLESVVGLAVLLVLGDCVHAVEQHVGDLVDDAFVQRVQNVALEFCRLTF